MTGNVLLFTHSAGQSFCFTEWFECEIPSQRLEWHLWRLQLQIGRLTFIRTASLNAEGILSESRQENFWHVLQATIKMHKMSRLKSTNSHYINSHTHQSAVTSFCSIECTKKIKLFVIFRNVEFIWSFIVNVYDKIFFGIYDCSSTGPT